MRIDAGALDRRITIMAATSSRGPTGQELETWQDVATVYAQRLNLGKHDGDHDIERELGLTAVKRTKYLIRYRSGVTTGHRIRLDDGSLFAITGIDDPDRRLSLILTLEEVA